MSGATEGKQKTADVSQDNGVKEEANIHDALIVADVTGILGVT